MPRGSKPGERRGGRQKNTPNKKTQAIADRLAALGCDPLELSAKIAIGQELDGPHPSVPAFRKFIDDLAKLRDKGGAITDDHIEQLTSLVEDNLTSGYVPYDLRSKHINELLQYVAPKRKAVDGDGSSDIGLKGAPGTRLVIGFVDADDIGDGK
jgi:hypothetical protein